MIDTFSARSLSAVSKLLVLGTVLLLGSVPILRAADQDVATVGPVPKDHSLDTVVVEEYLNFTCPHCNTFREASKPLFAKYGKRIKLVRMPVLFKGQTDPPLRLFFIAEAQGKQEMISDVLFDTAFKYNVDIYDPAVVGYLARTNGLAEAYQKDAASEWVSRRVQDVEARASTFGVNATPTVVVQGALRIVPEGPMADFIGTIDRVVGQLLKTKS